MSIGTEDCAREGHAGNPLIGGSRFSHLDDPIYVFAANDPVSVSPHNSAAESTRRATLHMRLSGVRRVVIGPMAALSILLSSAVPASASGPVTNTVRKATAPVVRLLAMNW